MPTLTDYNMCPHIIGSIWNSFQWSKALTPLALFWLPPLAHISPRPAFSRQTGSRDHAMDPFTVMQLEVSQTKAAWAALS